MNKLHRARPSTNLKMGVVGMPNIGKSTLFNILTSSSVPAENYPFCTIDPTEAKIRIPDKRLEFLTLLYSPSKVTPATLTVIDIAGLVKGASKGLGLGNAFLSNIQATDGIYHVLRLFKDKSISHVENSVNAIRDHKIITQELRLKDCQNISSHIKKGNSFMQHLQDTLLGSRPIHSLAWSDAEAEEISKLRLVSLKPAVHLVSLCEKDYFALINGCPPPCFQELQEYLRNEDLGSLIGYSGNFESLLSICETEDERQEVLADFASTFGAPVVKSVLDDIIWAGYDSVGLNHYFTCGAEEVKAWTVLKDSKAPQAAAVIHTDFEKAFIAAEVMRFEDLKEHGSEKAVKMAGKMRTYGKDAIIGDGDIVNFKLNRTALKA